MNEVKQCGYIAIVGRPNVGKSTLLNRILGKKISITSRKPQTTRHRILGIKTQENVQYLYVDTPGLHRHIRHILNQYMNRTVHQVLSDVDVIVWVVDARGWRQADAWVLSELSKLTVPIIVAVNKIDRLPTREVLLPYLEKLAGLHAFAQIIPLSAKSGEQIEFLEQSIAKFLPISPFLFPPEQVTDCSEQFIVAERIREKLTRHLGEELPYAITVTMDAFEILPHLIRIAAVIWVEKDSQKGIVIGQNGQILKQVGREARLDLQQYFGKKLYLQLWVKVKEDWSDNAKWLQQVGYTAE